jgi:hypothetical protein
MSISNIILSSSVIMAILKLSGDLDISWWVVTAPIVVPATMFFSFLICVMIISYWVESERHKRR